MKRATPERRPPGGADELDVVGDDLAAVAVVAVAILPAGVVDAPGHRELVALGFVAAQGHSHAVEDRDLVKLAVLECVAGVGVFLDAAVPNARAIGYQDQFGDLRVAAIAGIGIFCKPSDQLYVVHFESLQLFRWTIRRCPQTSPAREG